MDIKITRFIEKFSDEIRNENAAIFAGAGLSVPSGFVDWSSLLKPLAEEIRIDVDKESDLVSVAQYYKNETGNRSEISNRIISEFSKETDIPKNHKILSRLPISTYWTTNYDSLIEDSLKAVSKVVDVKYTVKQLAVTKPKRDAVIYKMHGDKEHPSEAVILKEDYELYRDKYAPFITALSGDLISKTFLFIGFSFSDPNLDYILSRVRVNYGDSQRTHYAFVKRVLENECKDKAEFEYLNIKQKLFLNDLKRYNIQALLIDAYSEITTILQLIENNINHNSIFISGSADSYGDWSEKEATEFISKLSAELIKRDNKIVSGFGLGVGSYVISGALNEIYMKKKIVNNETLILRPFPQGTTGEILLKDLWQKYREDMIALSGISIFIFGNKTDDNGNIINANGVHSEFKISSNKSNIIVPVGITGYASEEIWNEVNSNYSMYYPKSTDRMKELFADLNDINKKDCLIKTIIEFINEAKKSCIS